MLARKTLIRRSGAVSSAVFFSNLLPKVQPIFGYSVRASRGLARRGADPQSGSVSARV